ncbi:MAG: lipopolysaccharide biosynthesis protein [Chloroflexia bacterium]
MQGAIWSYGGFLASKGVLFVATLLLARLLSPADFGVVGMALLVITVFDILRDFGIGSALIQRSRDTAAAADMAFVLSTALGFVLFALNWVLAPLVTQFFQVTDPSQAELLPWLVRVLGLTLIFSSLGGTQDALLQKQLDYRSRTLPEVGRTGVKGIISVGLALAGWGVWSLVLGQVLGEACATVLLWIVSRWRPTFKLDFALLRPITSYGTQIMFVGGLGWLLSDVDYLIIGRLLGDVSLGIYTLAYRIPELIVRNLAQAVSNVAFPVAAKLQEDRAALRKAYLDMQHYMLLILAPLGFGLYAVTPALVRILFGAKWLAAIPVMELLSIYMVLGGVGHWPGVVYKAVGRPDILSRLSVVKLVLLVPTLWWAASAYGIVGVGWGQLIVRVITIFIDMVVVARFVNVSVIANLGRIWPPFAASIIMVVAVRAVFLLDPAEASPLILILAIIVGGLTYAAAAYLFDRRAITMLLDTALGMLRRRRTPAAVREA